VCIVRVAIGVCVVAVIVATVVSSVVGITVVVILTVILDFIWALAVPMVFLSSQSLADLALWG